MSPTITAPAITIPAPACALSPLRHRWKQKTTRASRTKGAFGKSRSQKAAFRRQRYLDVPGY